MKCFRKALRDSNHAFWGTEFTLKIWPSPHIRQRLIRDTGIRGFAYTLPNYSTFAIVMHTSGILEA